MADEKQNKSEEIKIETPDAADEAKAEEEIPVESAEEIPVENAEEIPAESAEETVTETGDEVSAAEAEGTEAEGPEEDKEDEKASMFGRKKKEIEKCKAQIDELTDKLKRNMAEFENFRKRTEKEKSSMYIIGARDIVEKILPVVDSFERGLAQAQEGDPFADGMKLVYKQLMTALEDLGVAPIEAVGKEFDPNLHNAVMHVDDESLGENVVVEELQKGYTYRGTVVRHSMVKVAN